jgi:hypothetical protein
MLGRLLPQRQQRCALVLIALLIMMPLTMISASSGQEEEQDEQQNSTTAAATPEAGKREPCKCIVDIAADIWIQEGTVPWPKELPRSDVHKLLGGDNRDLPQKGGPSRMTVNLEIDVCNPDNAFLKEGMSHDLSWLYTEGLGWRSFPDPGGEVPVL